jgi:hypothetical protein
MRTEGEIRKRLRKLKNRRDTDLDLKMYDDVTEASSRVGELEWVLEETEGDHEDE